MPKIYSKSYTRYLKRKNRIETVTKSIDWNSLIANNETSNSVSADNYSDELDVTDNTASPIQNIHDRHSGVFNQPIEDDKSSSGESDDQTEQNDDMIMASFLALFFSANLTQTALKLVIEHTQLFTNIELPKSFDQLMSKLHQQQLLKTRKFFCQKCQIEFNYEDLIISKQRKCQRCDVK